MIATIYWTFIGTSIRILSSLHLHLRTVTPTENCRQKTVLPRKVVVGDTRHTPLDRPCCLSVRVLSGSQSGVCNPAKAAEVLGACSIGGVEPMYASVCTCVRVTSLLSTAAALRTHSNHLSSSHPHPGGAVGNCSLTAVPSIHDRRFHGWRFSRKETSSHSRN